MALVDTIADPAAEFADDLIEREADRQDCAALMTEIDKLPDDQRQALLLTSWDGLAVKDASEVMQIPHEQVRKQKDKAAGHIRHTRAGRVIGRDYYLYVSVSRFKTTFTSSVEEVVLRAEAALAF